MNIGPFPRYGAPLPRPQRIFSRSDFPRKINSADIFGAVFFPSVDSVATTDEERLFCHSAPDHLQGAKTFKQSRGAPRG